jgi:hypothetical protein
MPGEASACLVLVPTFRARDPRYEKMRGRLLGTLLRAAEVYPLRLGRWRIRGEPFPALLSLAFFVCPLRHVIAGLARLPARLIVAPRAMGDLGSDGMVPALVLGLGDWLEVVGIHAELDPAEMV